MCADRLEEPQSPLTDLLFDQDPFESEIFRSRDISPASFVSLDMTQNQYQGRTNRMEGMQVNTNISDTSSGSGSSSTGGPNSSDIAPFSAVSSFNYPAAVDSNLLTPVSSAAGSPPLQQQNKNMQFSQHSGQPTPPSSSRMFYPSFDHPSTMTVQPQATESHFEMANYVDNNGNNNNTSPSPHMEPFFGHYGVSGAMETDEPFSMPEQHGLDINPSAMMASHMAVGATHLQNTMFPGTPLLVQQAGAGFRRSPGVEDLGLSMSQPTHHFQSSPRKQMMRRKTNPKAPRRVRTSGSTPDLAVQQPSPALPVDGADAPRLTLKENAPEDDKYLFELRRQYLDHKGKGMWESIRDKYVEKYGNSEKAALQMKISRAVCKYGVWPQTEEELLLAAFKHDEEHRYARIIARMKELGGGQVWEWKPAHIEAKLVAMGLEEAQVDEKTNLRRRRKMAQRRRSSTLSGGPAPGEWAPTGLGLHPAHAAMGSRRTSYDMLSGDELSLTPAPLTAEQTDALLDQIHMKAEPESSPAPEMELLDYDDERNNASPRQQPHFRHDINHQHSERVARQACEQLMAERHHRLA